MTDYNRSAQARQPRGGSPPGSAARAMRGPVDRRNRRPPPAETR